MTTKETIWGQLKSHLTTEEQEQIKTDNVLKNKLAVLAEKLIESHNLPKPKSIIFPPMYFYQMLTLFPEARKRYIHMSGFMEVFKDHVVVVDR